MLMATVLTYKNKLIKYLTDSNCYINYTGIVIIFIVCFRKVLNLGKRLLKKKL